MRILGTVGGRLSVIDYGIVNAYMSHCFLLTQNYVICEITRLSRSVSKEIPE